MSLTKKRFPNRLRECRLNARMTLEELAERCNVVESTISRHETGARGMTQSQIQVYADALGVSPEDIGVV